MARFKFTNILAILICFALSYPVSADPGKISPYVSVKQEYSDNILFTGSNEEEDFITTTSAGMVLSRDTERLDASVNARLMQLFYLDNDQLNTLDGSVSGTWNYQVTEKAGVGTAASFRKDSRRDRDTDTTGLVLSGDREEANFSISPNYLFSEALRGELTLKYGFSEVDEDNYDEDNKTLVLDLAFSKNLSKTFKNTTGLLNFSYMRYSSDIETLAPGPLITTINYLDYTSDIFQMYAGFSRAVTELYNVYLQAGTSYTDTTEERRTRLTGIITSDDTLPDQNSSTWGGVLMAGLNYDGLYYDAGLSISHDVKGSSGTNGSVERSAVSLNVDKKVSENFFITFDTSCYLNRNDRTTQADLDELTINIQPGFRYRFFDTFTFSGVYRYTSVENRQSDNTSERNLVYFVLRKDFHL